MVAAVYFVRLRIAHASMSGVIPARRYDGRAGAEVSNARMS